MCTKLFYFNGVTRNCVHVYHAQVRSWTQPILSNELKDYWARKHCEHLLGFELINKDTHFHIAIFFIKPNTEVLKTNV